MTIKTYNAPGCELLWINPRGFLAPCFRGFPFLLLHESCVFHQGIQHLEAKTSWFNHVAKPMMIKHCGTKYKIALSNIVSYVFGQHLSLISLDRPSYRLVHHFGHEVRRKNVLLNLTMFRLVPNQSLRNH